MINGYDTPPQWMLEDSKENFLCKNADALYFDNKGCAIVLTEDKFCPICENKTFELIVRSRKITQAIRESYFRKCKSIMSDFPNSLFNAIDKIINEAK